MTTMNSMFQTATSFNKNVASMNVVKVTDMSRMFQGASAYNNAGVDFADSFNTGLVTTMEGMFQDTPNFVGGGIVNLDLTNVASLENMFNGASSFQQDLCAWGNVWFGLFGFFGFVSVTDMFSGTNCGDSGFGSTADPSLQFDFTVSPLCKSPC